MNRLDERFDQLKKEGAKAFIPFLSAGDPDLATTAKLLMASQDSGADAIELGIPFSDPIADGPTIQASFTRALATGLKVHDCLDMVKAVRAGGLTVPVVAMLSYSIVYRMGPEAFIRAAQDAGFDGATIPDLPVDEARSVDAFARERDFRMIYLVAPTTDQARRDAIVKHARGFLYYISVRGITGVRSELPPDLADNIARLQHATDTPVAVGFGIGTPERAAQVARIADGVIVGSAIVKLVHQKTPEGPDAVTQAVAHFVKQLAAATKSVKSS